MLAKLGAFFSAVGFIFSFFIYTSAFLSPEIACALGAQNCVSLVVKSVFRNFAFFLTLGFFLSFVTNFAKFFVDKEGYKIAVVTNLLFNLLTFLVSGVLLITAITSVEAKDSVNIMAILVWAWSFINVVTSLLEMKPTVALSHTVDTGGYTFGFSVLMFLLLGCIGCLILSNTFVSKRSNEKLEILSGSISQERAGGVDLTSVLSVLERIREDIRASGGVNIDYSRIESVMKSAIVSAFSEITGRRLGGEQEKPQEYALSEFEIESDYFLGSKDAPVTIVEFFAYTCPYCVMMHSVIKEVLKKYPDKVRYVQKHFPLDFPVVDGGEAVDTKIAEVVEAAGAQGKYWEMSDRVMEKMAELMKTNVQEFGEIHGGKDAFTRAQKYLKEIANELGLDYGKIEEALDKGTYKQKIERHKEVGRKVGVRGTPAVYINGKAFRDNTWLRKGAGGQPEGNPEPFYKVIEEELKKLGK
ncbi:MAG: DsbA family protein [Planctomycetota bacterium]